MPSSTIDAAKQAVRERVWNLLEAEHAVDPGVHGHIPDFVGTTAAGATMRAAADHALRLAVDELRPIDLVVCGSVAVNRHGDRIGKGAGYSDLEVALLHDAGILGPHTVIATTVHSLRVLDEELPATDHDFQVDLIVTAAEVVSCDPSRRRSGIRWDDLPPDYLSAIPVLASLSSSPPEP